MDTNIAALRKKTEGTDSKVKEKASKLLKRSCGKLFLLTNLGILNV